ncbi:major facilitator superfamily domain-containing protein [Multifurca ochricompacta]|uniref:Major facilitator superfamily domain-containing protein n=1 Tax=Multifurca ochricompacta TaxID=376703 RepID=A0AAD4MBV3_9AGAM|nr:major facilitator superfamily domain-containing protein [Multifurca ochricompacta]
MTQPFIFPAESDLVIIYIKPQCLELMYTRRCLVPQAILSMTSKLVPTILNFSHSAALPWPEPHNRPQNSLTSITRTSAQTEEQGETIELGRQNPRGVVPVEGPSDHGELKLPKMRSLVIMIFTNVLLQTTFFIIVSSGSKYAEHLGGSATFSGLVIGVPTVISGITLIPLVRRDGGAYKFALHLCCAAALVGSILYGLAYRAHFLYLILIGRIVMGVSFAQFMYTKRYCSDPRIVGVRQRTTLAGWLVVGQSAGFTVGPFVGGLLYKIGFGNAIFNGYTGPGWIMAAVWLVFWVVITVLFEDVPHRYLTPLPHIDRRVTETSSQQHAPSPQHPSSETHPTGTMFPSHLVESAPHPPATELSNDAPLRVSVRQWAVTATMCWFAMTCFFVLGAWEANIPIFSARAFDASPFAAGNLIALGGVCTFPFMFANVVLARRVQDRHILAAGCALGLFGLLVAMAVITTGHATFGNLFASWFFVALGFNLASTVTLSLLSKQMPHSWNGKISLFIQYSNYSGRVSGAVWGGAGVDVGMTRYVGLQIALLGIGGVMFMRLWKEMKAKTG